MSQQRTITIRLGDWMVGEALEIALAQCGVRFLEERLPYLTIEGDKSKGMVLATTYQNQARVYLTGDGDGPFSTVRKVEIVVLDGEKLEHPRVIQFSNYEGLHSNLLVILHCSVQLRNEVVYQLIETAEGLGYDYAPSILSGLWKYPLVKADGKEVQLVWEPQNMGIEKITMNYSFASGYTKATINQSQFICDWLTGKWTKIK